MISTTIEHFWALLSRLVYEDGWKAQSYNQFINKGKSKVKKVAVRIKDNGLPCAI